MHITPFKTWGYTLGLVNNGEQPCLLAGKNVVLAGSIDDLLEVQHEVPDQISQYTLKHSVLSEKNISVLSADGLWTISGGRVHTHTLEPQLPALTSATQIGVVTPKQAKVLYPSEICEAYPALVPTRRALIDAQHRDSLVRALEKTKLHQYLVLKRFFEEEYAWDDVLAAKVRNGLRNVFTSRKTAETHPQRRLLAHIKEHAEENELVCQTRESSYENRREIADQLQSELHQPVHACKHIPYVVVRADRTSADKLFDTLCTRRRTFHSRALRHIGRVRHGQFRYIPELLTEVSPWRSRFTRNRGADLWHLSLIHARIAQQVSYGNGVRVVVADTGADIHHREIAHLFNKEHHGYNFVKHNHNVSDDNGHGTHVIGLVGGKSVGVAPGCDLYAAKVLNARGWGSEATLIEALEWCIDKRMDIVNMSLGSSRYSNMEAAVVQEVLKRGISIIAAAGNEGHGASYPAAYPGVVSVAAVNRRKEHAKFSNIHSTVDISAPGVLVYSCIPGGRYASWSGTSMATPLVTGSAALVHSKKRLGQEQLQAHLYRHCERLGKPKDRPLFGAGLVRPDRSVTQLRGGYYGFT